MLHFHLQFEAEIKYSKEVQKLYKTPYSDLVGKICPDEINQTVFENLVDITPLTALMLASLITSVDLLTRFSNSTYLINKKLITIFIIFCQSSHRNNSN